MSGLRFRALDMDHSISGTSETSFQPASYISPGLWIWNPHPMIASESNQGLFGVLQGSYTVSLAWPMIKKNRMKEGYVYVVSDTASYSRM